MVCDFRLMSIMSEVILVGIIFFVCAKDALVKAACEIKIEIKIERITLKIMKKLWTILFFIAAINQTFADEVKDFNRNPKNYNVKLQIFDGKTKVASFMVASAKTKAAEEYGLMNLKHLNAQNGMLFSFGAPQIVNMWMKNTLISLDMIFIDAHNNIVNIKEGAVPLSLEVISSQKNVTKVLEINGGLCRKFDIKIGQKIVYENF